MLAVRSNRDSDGSSPVDGLLGNETKDETAFEAAIRSAGNRTRREMLPVERSCSRERDRKTNGVIDARGTRQTVKLRRSNDRLLENKTERQTVSSTGGEQDKQRSSARQTIVFSRTRPRDRRSHRRAGNKNPERCRSNDRKRCRIRDRSHFDPVGGPTVAKLTKAMANFGVLFIYGALARSHPRCHCSTS